MVVNVALVGVGLVGSEFIRQVLQTQSKKIAIIAVANSRKFLTSNVPLTESWNTELTSGAENTQPFTLDAFTASLSASKASHPTVVLDCTSNEAVAAYYPTWLEAGFHVVTPNKKAFSGDLGLYKRIKELTSQPGSPLIYHESTVGAGLPVINTLNDLVNTGDKIVKIEGIFSGTLSYIFNNFSTLDASAAPVTFSEVVTRAKELGYTEPDPRDDLNGMDVARKVMILGRVAGLDLTQETLQVENIVPESLRTASASDFMATLPQFDQHFADLKDEATKAGQVLRYVGLVDPVHGKSSVTLARYPASHPFASLKGSDNIIAFTTERFPSPLIIQGSGAGAAVTAFGIYSDILKIAERTRH
ncbi:MAG: homoserine dehydrogenase-domain-containing protein [Benniella sp.]|nr:MAG: homoserine dehydrogenase-domain-containing protein [Benniella sp.]